MLHKGRISIWLVLFGIVKVCAPVLAQEMKTIPPGSRVFIAPMGGFEADLKAALNKRQVPLEIVGDREKADYEITGQSESQKASTAKKIIQWDWRSTEEASINVANIKSGEVVFAYSVHKPSSAHGKRSAAEACAKHLKEVVRTK